MTFNLVIKIDQDFVERQLAMQHDAARIERFGVVHLSAFFQDELQDVADVLVRAKHIRFHDRFADFIDQTRVGQMRRVIDRATSRRASCALRKRHSGSWR